MSMEDYGVPEVTKDESSFTERGLPKPSRALANTIVTMTIDQCKRDRRLGERTFKDFLAGKASENTQLPRMVARLLRDTKVVRPEQQYIAAIGAHVMYHILDIAADRMAIISTEKFSHETGLMEQPHSFEDPLLKEAQVRYDHRFVRSLEELEKRVVHDSRLTALEATRYLQAIADAQNKPGYVPIDTTRLPRPDLSRVASILSGDNF